MINLRADVTHLRPRKPNRIRIRSSDSGIRSLEIVALKRPFAPWVRGGSRCWLLFYLFGRRTPVPAMHMQFETFRARCVLMVSRLARRRTISG